MHQPGTQLGAGHTQMIQGAHLVQKPASGEKMIQVHTFRMDVIAVQGVTEIVELRLGVGRAGAQDDLTEWGELIV